MIRALMIASVFLIQGCTNPTVHLYAKYLNAEQQKNVVEQLEKHEFTVTINQLDFPKMINDSAIIYSPFLSDNTKVHELEASVSAINWPVNYVSALKEGNHWFQKNSIGLFLVPENIEPHSGKNMIDLAQSYVAESCAEELTLALLSEGGYEFSRVVRDENYSYGKVGHWRMRAYPYIELKPLNKDRWLYFEVQQKQVQDKIGVVNVFTLKPMENYAALKGCQFVYGERS